MASWHKPMRIGVAIVGIASAAAVYFAMGERRSAPPAQPVQRIDPNASIEISGSQLDRLAGLKKLLQLKHADHILSYPDGTTKVINGTFVIPKGEDRTFTISAQETSVGKDENHLAVSGAVRLDDSDGFFLTTDQATYDADTSIAETSGTVMFGKGRMRGSGTGMTYDQKNDVLRVNNQAQVTTVDETGKPVMQFTSTSAMLDRVQHVLTADTKVHVVREKQVIDTNHAEARLSEMNDIVTLMQLRGDSRVTGGEASIDTMSARDLDLDYTDDGKTLEAVKLAGSGAIAMTGTEGKPGRKIAGETVDLALAPDGTLTRAIANGNVILDLPASADVPQRTIASQGLNATGQPGKGLTNATFTAAVVFTEQPKGADTDGPRTARAQKLEASLADDAVTAATFTGGEVTFEETGLKGCSARLEYEPGKGSLVLSGATNSGNPIVAQERVAVEGQTIDVALETRRMVAKGMATTLVRSVARCKPSRARPQADQGASRTPGLLKDDAPVIISADNLEYDSKTGYATYTGKGSRRPTLEQGADTSIAADMLVLDEMKGDLRATGNALSTLTLDGKRMTGRAAEIRYTDDRRLVTYSATKSSTELYLGSGPDSNIRAVGRIDISLDEKSNTVKEMRASNRIRVIEGNNTVTGGPRSELKYTGADEKYVVTSGGTNPVIIIQRDGSGCREQSGDSVTFYKGKNNAVTIDQGTSRVSMGPSKSTCAPSTP